jgi:uncharacterized protein YdaU (DUF1376 family)
MQYYNHHIGDFKRDTSFLCHKKRSIYLELIWLYYDTEQPLPLDISLLARKCVCDEIEVSDILSLFFVEEDDGYHHKRIDEELQKVYERSEKAKQSAFKRWESKPITVRQKKVIDSTQFDRFWNIYPAVRRNARDKCLKTWAVKKCDDKIEEIIKHLKEMIESEQWRNPQFIPLATTYITQERWTMIDDSHSKWQLGGI